MKQYNNIISVVTSVLLAGCLSSQSDRDPVMDTPANSSAFSAPTSHTKPTLAVADAPQNSDGELKRLHVGPHKVECEGFQLQQCLMVRFDDDAKPQYFYDDITGFDYEWGYAYDLLVRKTVTHTEIADQSAQQYELVSVLEKSEYLGNQTFDYVARHGNTSLWKTGSQEYQLPGSKSIVCDAELCSSVDSIFEQAQSAVLTLQYQPDPEAPLQLVSISCSDSKGSFNDSCMNH